MNNQLERDGEEHGNGARTSQPRPSKQHKINYAHHVKQRGQLEGFVTLTKEKYIPYHVSYLSFVTASQLPCHISDNLGINMTNLSIF
ncbi:hypothetical protein NC653_014672 [Populus alba x Populus x berolinensis]|uniref:Uncharacterized protein n=1 Tax=Populus alba x Populus x berolinensis TaxID=444605 RepID=A0AAD6QXM9_9ROSI|nr:hypothetical protein NC653_014672 [Populus alba x Populus x berolinensis]